MNYTAKQLYQDIHDTRNDEKALVYTDTDSILSDICCSFYDCNPDIDYEVASKLVLPLIYIYAKRIDFGEESLELDELLRCDINQEWQKILDFDLIQKDPILLGFFKKHYNAQSWYYPLVEAATKYDYKELYFTFFIHSSKVSNNVSDLIDKVLVIQDKDTVLDLDARCGRKLGGKHSHYYATVKDTVRLVLEHEWADFNETPEYLDQLIHAGVFNTNIIREKTQLEKFDKVYPASYSNKKLSEISDAEELISKLVVEIPELYNATSANWLYAINTAELLSERGRGIVYASKGSLWNKKDAPLRKYLIEKGMIEAVINIQQSSVNSGKEEGPAALIVLSHNNNTVKFIDRDLKFEREGNRFYIENTDKKTIETINDEIVCLLNNGGEESEYYIEVDYEDLKEYGYSFNINRYTHSDDLVENGIPFGKVIKSIRRGITLNDSDFEKYKSPIKTHYSYLMSSQIEDGKIASELTYLNYIDPKQEKYCLKNNNIVITKNGSPHKIAVAVLSEDEMILCANNCFIVELDTERIDPYYLQAYLMSDKGMNSLEKITTGNNVKTIGVSDLRELLIPCPDLEKQYAISASLKRLIDKIEKEKKELEEQRNKLSEVFFRGE